LARERRVLDADLRARVSSEEVVSILEDELLLSPEDGVARKTDASRRRTGRTARHRRDEAVTLADHGLDKSRHIRIVVKCLSNLTDRSVDRGVVLDEHA